MFLNLIIAIGKILFSFFSINKIILFLNFYILILCESSRIPFDFIEGESELVSGFNIEFFRSYFSLFFIYEYGIILFLRILSRFVFLNLIFSIFIIYLFILIRSSFPRLRYDQIINFF